MQRSNMIITTREATASDASSVAELFDLYRQFYEQVSDLPLANAFIADRINNRESVILLAMADGIRPLGFCQLYPTFCSVEARSIYTLYDLFVVPDARGNGAGAMLLRAAEARARADGKARMDLTTARTNHHAQMLYELMGWVRDDVFLAYSRRIAE